MHTALHSLVAGAFALVWSGSAEASPHAYDVVDEHTCIAGHTPERAQREWRVQLGLFQGGDGSDELKRSLEVAGLEVETLTARWVDDEHTVLVSPVFASRAAARRAAKLYRLAGVTRPFARRFRLLLD